MSPIQLNITIIDDYDCNYQQNPINHPSSTITNHQQNLESQHTHTESNFNQNDQENYNQFWGLKGFLVSPNHSNQIKPEPESKPSTSSKKLYSWPFTIPAIFSNSLENSNTPSPTSSSIQRDPSPLSHVKFEPTIPDAQNHEHAHKTLSATIFEQMSAHLDSPTPPQICPLPFQKAACYLSQEPNKNEAVLIQTIEDAFKNTREVDETKLKSWQTQLQSRIHFLKQMTVSLHYESIIISKLWEHIENQIQSFKRLHQSRQDWLQSQINTPIVMNIIMGAVPNSVHQLFNLTQKLAALQAIIFLHNKVLAEIGAIKEICYDHTYQNIVQFFNYCYSSSDSQEFVQLEQDIQALLPAINQTEIKYENQYRLDKESSDAHLKNQLKVQKSWLESCQKNIGALLKQRPQGMSSLNDSSIPDDNGLAKWQSGAIQQASTIMQELAKLIGMVECSNQNILEAKFWSISTHQTEASLSFKVAFMKQLSQNDYNTFEIVTKNSETLKNQQLIWIKPFPQKIQECQIAVNKLEKLLQKVNEMLNLNSDWL